MSRAGELLDVMIDRPVPRIITAVAASAVVAAGTYELGTALTVSAEDHNADVQACAKLLGEQAAKVRTADVPETCESFKTSFSYRDTTVHVVARNGENEDTTTHTRIYEVPNVQSFRAANLETQEEADRNNDAVKGVTGVVAGIDTLLIFGATTFVARRRRFDAQRQSEEAMAAAA